jgi:HJR/Mrr/RecB family endonuclease
LSVSERILLILYHRKTNGITFNQLSTLVVPSQRKNLKRTLATLEYKHDAIVFHDNIYKITRIGELEVERKQLVMLS